MNTLSSILLGFLLFIFISVTIVLMSGWIIMQVMYDNKKIIIEEECGCNTCDCDEPFIIEDDTIPMLDRPLTKKELKEVNMEEQNKEYNIMTARDMMTMKTEVKQTASPENINKSHRGKSYKNMEPREENDPNPPKK